MTDIEKLRKVFDELGITYTTHTVDGSVTLALEAKTGNIQGYSGFVAEFQFDQGHGYLEKVGVWE